MEIEADDRIRKKLGQRKGLRRGVSQPEEEEMKAYLFFSSLKNTRVHGNLNRMKAVFFDRRNCIFGYLPPQACFCGMEPVLMK